MECINCHGRELVQNPITGEVVCATCGVVNEIYYVAPELDYGEVAYSQEIYTYNYELRIKKQRIDDYTKILAIKRRPGIGLNPGAVTEYLRSKKMVKTLLRSSSKRALESLTDKNLKIAYNVISSLPELTGRTEKTKVALALYFLRIAQGRNLDSRELHRLGIKPLYLSRVLREIKFERKIKITELVKKSLPDYGPAGIRTQDRPVSQS